jgi:flagellar motor switch protein FliM
MGIPLAMVEPIVKVMSAARLKDSQSKTRTIEWRRPFNGIEVPVTAEWVVKDMPISEVIRLRPGDVLEMNRDLIAQTRVRFSNTTEFIGTAGVEDGRVAVRLTQRKPLE